MPRLSSDGQATQSDNFSAIAAAIPGGFLARQDVAGAADALARLAQFAATGPLPMSAVNAAPDPVASLWFIRAAHLFGVAGGDAALRSTLLPLCKRLLQNFITAGGVGEITMDNGGLLVPAANNGAAKPSDASATPAEKAPPETADDQSLRLNALWYSALESTAADLRAARDPSADHFERLAGRFRRTFAKVFWCEGHNAICPPYLRLPDSHGPMPDLDQLLLTVLPASPIPRTKQRQLLQFVRAKSLPAAGAHSPGPGLLMDHPRLGRVESVLHRAWLGVGVLASADNRNAVLADATEILAPLKPLLADSEAHGDADIPAYFRDGRPVSQHSSDPVVAAEIRGAFRLLKPL